MVIKVSIKYRPNRFDTKFLFAKSPDGVQTLAAMISLGNSFSLVWRFRNNETPTFFGALDLNFAGFRSTNLELEIAEIDVNRMY